MNRSMWLKRALFCLMVVGLVDGVAWGLPSGLGDVTQILDGRTIDPNGGQRQRTFLTTDQITFQATYYDNNAACSGVAPTFVQLFVFNSEGVFVQQFNADSLAFGGTPKYRTLFQFVASGTLASGNYAFTFLVRDCTNTKSTVLPVFPTFRVLLGGGPPE